MTTSTWDAIDQQALIPEISYFHVQQALKDLERKNAIDVPNPLHYLEVIDQQLLEPKQPRSPEKRLFEFRIFLTKLITEVFTEVRRLNNRALPLINETKSEAEAQIFQDILSENSELIGWSWLYYHYVRVDLNITRRDFRRPELFHDRTYTRFRTFAEKRLTEIIYERESKVKQQRKRAALNARLPRQQSPLFGRTALIEHIHRLRQRHPHIRIQLYGASGSGKTAVVVEAMRQQLAEIDHLIWLSRPEDIEQIRETVCAELGISFDEVNAYATRNAVTLVIDNGDDLYDDGKQLEALLRAMPTVSVFLIGHRHLLLEPVDAYMAVAGLDYFAAHEYLNYLQSLHFHALDHPLNPVELEQVWRSSEGNPAALKRELMSFFGPD